MIESKSDHIREIGQQIQVNVPVQGESVDMGAVYPDNADAYIGPAIIGKIKGTNTDFSMESKRLINALLESNIVTGNLVVCGAEKHLIIASRKQLIEGVEASILAHSLVCNATISVTREELEYDEYGNVSGSATVTVLDALPCYAAQVNDRMRQTDAGLLQSTVMKLYGSFVDGLINGDKATVLNRNYRIEDINDSEFPGVMILQLAVWTG